MLDVPFTANARAMGGRQLDAFQAHMVGNIQISTGGTQPINRLDSTVVNQGGPGLTDPYVGNVAQIIADGVHGIPRIGHETRSANVAYYSRIHV